MMILGVLEETAAAVGVIGAVAGLFAHYVRPTRRRVDDFLEDWNGSVGRPGVPGRAGVMERLVAIESHFPPGGVDILTSIDQLRRDLRSHTANCETAHATLWESISPKNEPPNVPKQVPPGGESS